MCIRTICFPFLWTISSYCCQCFSIRICLSVSLSSTYLIINLSHFLTSSSTLYSKINNKKKIIILSAHISSFFACDFVLCMIFTRQIKIFIQPSLIFFCLLSFLSCLERFFFIPRVWKTSPMFYFTILGIMQSSPLHLIEINLWN